jgi:hypothetical protein
MSTHTPEPWYWGDGFDNLTTKYASCQLFGAGDIEIITTRIDHYEPIWDFNPETGEGGISHANRARIVACVNAMAGIPDPAALVKSHGELVEALKDSEQKVWRLEGEVGSLSGKVEELQDQLAEMRSRE